MKKYFFSTTSHSLLIKYSSNSLSTQSPYNNLCEENGLSLFIKNETHWEIINCWYSSNSEISLDIDLSKYLSNNRIDQINDFMIIHSNDAPITNVEVFNNQMNTIPFSNFSYQYQNNIFDTSNILFGAVNWNQNRSFNKYSCVSESEKKLLSSNAQKEFRNLCSNTSSCFLEFQTMSTFVKIDAILSRSKAYLKIPFAASHGFDFYELDPQENTYRFRKTFYPTFNTNTISFEFIHNPNSIIRIYFPLYNVLEDLTIYTESEIIPIHSQRKKVIFYGNSITQGASASRPALSFTNLLSLKRNWEIINYSLSSCCKAFPSIAQNIAENDADYIFLDYSRNAWSSQELRDNLTNFYSIIRKSHPTIPIIFMTTACFNNEVLYDNFDDTINSIYNQAQNSDSNIYLINQKKIFTKEEYAFCCIDGEHYTDYGMKKVAEAILKLPLY